MEFSRDFALMGFFTHTNKEKTKQFYVIQVLISWSDKYSGLPKSKIKNIYVDSDVYSQVSAMEIGSLVPVIHTPDYATDDILYSMKNF